MDDKITVPDAMDNTQRKEDNEQTKHTLSDLDEFETGTAEDCGFGQCQSCPCSQGEFGYGCELGEW